MKFFDSIILLRSGKIKVAVEEFYGSKQPKKIGMLMLIIW